MRDHLPSPKDWGWWSSEWKGNHPLNTDKVDDWEISPRELSLRLERGEPLVLVDVREPWEANIVSLPGSRLIPLNELRYRAEEEIDPEDEVVLYCHHGIRSMEGAMVLWEFGYEKVRSLAGGISRWVLQVDPSLSDY